MNAIDTSPIGEPRPTTQADIIEAFAKADALTELERAWLYRQGVEAVDLADVRAGEVFWHPGSATFEIEPFNADTSASRSLIFLALDSLDQPSDLVAWSARSSKIGAWLGAACILGEDAILGPRINVHGALPIFRSPIGWLRAQRRGLVIVNPLGAAKRLLWRGPFLGEDEAHAAELRRLLAIAPPKVFAAEAPERVPAPDARAAA